VANGEAVAAGRAPADSLGVEALDDLTLRIRLEAPRSSLAAELADVAFSPIHPGSVESDRRPFVGNGPYRVASWTPGAELSLERNPHFREQAAVEAVQYFSLGRWASSEAADLYRRGELDIAPVEYQDLAWAQENAPDELQSSDIQAVSYAVIAGKDGAWGRSLEARAALALALDRAALTRSVSPPGLRPLDTLLPGRVAGYGPEPSPERATAPAERRARAAELLSSVPGPLSEIRLCTDTERGPSRRQVLAVGLLWNLALGVKPVAVQHGNAGTACDVRLVTITTDIADPLNALEALADEVGAESAPDAARHLRAAAAEADPRVRAERLGEAERALLASRRIVPLWQEVAHVLVKPRVTGWQASDPYRPTRFLATAD
jgi:oligopeptide transport system substrate-binding protein